VKTRFLRRTSCAIVSTNLSRVAFVSMGESIDTTSSTGRLLLGIMGSFAEFEWERIKDRTVARITHA
jgi:DNA invertase Pin-like site-specific DNA recombinase